MSIRQFWRRARWGRLQPAADFSPLRVRTNSVAFVDTFVRDLRHALRALRRNPAFTAAALLTLAVGIGANTAVFSVINSVLLRPLPYPHSGQLVALRQMAPGAAGLAGIFDGLPLSSSIYFTYARNNRTFQSLGVFRTDTAAVTGLAEPEQVRTVGISDASALGKRFVEILGRPWYEVIGVVQDVRETGVDQNAPAIVYWPALLDYWFFPGPRAWGDVAFVLRTDLAGTESLVKQIQQAVWSVNTNLPVASPQTMQETYDQSIARASFTLAMLAIAGAMALLLGLVGIYGVIAYAVSQRRREIGIRLALGAEPANLKRLFVRRGLALAGIGVAIGLPASAALMRLLKSLLFGISPLDPLAFAAAAALLVAAAGLASFLPARRALRAE